MQNLLCTTITLSCLKMDSILNAVLRLPSDLHASGPYLRHCVAGKVRNRGSTTRLQSIELRLKKSKILLCFTSCILHSQSGEGRHVVEQQWRNLFKSIVGEKAT